MSETQIKHHTIPNIQDLIPGEIALSTKIEPKLEGEGLKTSLKSSQEGLREDLESPTSISGGIIFVRHGDTAANRQGDRRKSKDEPLSDDELEGNGYLQYTINEIKELGINPKDITLHLPAMTLRSVQSAQIIAKGLNIGFPNDLTIFIKYNTLDNHSNFITDVSNFLASTTTNTSINIEKDYCYDGTPEEVQSYLQEYSEIIQQCLSKQGKASEFCQESLQYPILGSLNQLLTFFKKKQEYWSGDNATQQQIIYQAEKDTIQQEINHYPVICTHGLDPRFKGRKGYEKTPTHGNVKNKFGTESKDAAADRNLTYLMDVQSNNQPGKRQILVGHRYMEPAFAKQKYKLNEVPIPNKAKSEDRDRPANWGIIYQNQKGQIINQSYPRYVELSGGSNEYIKGKPSSHTSQSHVNDLVEKLTSISNEIGIKFYWPHTHLSLIEQQNYLNANMYQIYQALTKSDNKHHQAIIQQILSSDNSFLLHLLGDSIKHNSSLVQYIIQTSNISNQSAKILFEHSYLNKQPKLWTYCFGQMNHNTRLRLDLPLNDTTIQDLIGLYAQKESYLTGSNKHLLQIKSIGGGEMIDLENIYVEQEFDNPQGPKSTKKIADQITTHPGIYQIYGAGGEGKSTTLKAIAKYLLTTQTPPPLITWITPNTNIEELSTSDLNQVWLIDSVDELGSGGELFIQKIQTIIKSKQNISCISGSRTKSSNISSDNIFSTLPITEAQKDKYVSSYLNEVFGSDEGKPKELMEQTITKLGKYHLNPLMISMIAHIIEDEDLSIELENIQTKSDLYRILIKVLKNEGKKLLTKEKKIQYFHNPYKGDKFDEERIMLLGNGYITDNDFSGSNDHSSSFSYNKEIDTNNIGPEICKSSFLFEMTENFPNHIDLINTLTCSGLLQTKPNGSVYCIHKSILEYAGYQFINTKVRLKEMNFMTKLVDVILTDTFHEFCSIKEDYAYYITDLYMDNIITQEEYYNHTYQKNSNVLNFDQYIQKYYTHQDMFTSNKIVDIYYFEGKKSGNKLITLFLENLPQIIKQEKISNNGHRLIILSLIQGIKDNQNYNNTIILNKLEAYIKTNQIEKFI